MNKGIWIVAAVALASLAGCAAATSNTPAAATPVAGYVKGMVTALGSVWVNGVEYDTTSASVAVDGTAGAATDLKVGMNVEFTSETDPVTKKAKAKAVNYESSLKGTIASVDPTAGTFTVMGQTVQTGTLTVYEGVANWAALSTMTTLPFVEVSGQADPTTKNIVADRIEVKTGTLPKAKVGGKVTGIDPNALTVTLANEAGKSFTVTYTGTLDPAVIVGAQVRVKLDPTSTASALKAAATDIVVRQGEAKDKVQKGDKMEVQGVVGDDYLAGPPATFSIGTQKVSVDSTVLGTKKLAPGSKVELKGSLDAANVLVVSQLEVRKTEAELKAAVKEVKGTVTAVDLAARTVTITPTGGTAVVLTVDAKTLFRGALTGTDPLSKLVVTAGNTTGDSVEAVYVVDAATAVKTAIKVGVEGKEGDSFSGDRPDTDAAHK